MDQTTGSTSLPVGTRETGPDRSDGASPLPEAVVWVRSYRDTGAALRNPALGVPIWQHRGDPRPAFQLIARMPSMHDDEVARRLLQQLSALLSPATLGARRTASAEAVHALLEAAIISSGPQGSIDLVDRFTSLLAPSYLAQVFGLQAVFSPAQLRGFSAAIGTLLADPTEAQADSAATQVESAMNALSADLERRRSRLSPDDPLVPVLSRAASTDDLVAAIAVLAAGGQETVSALAANTILRLIVTPSVRDQFDRDPYGVVDEVARLAPPITMLARSASTATHAAGTPVEAGNLVLVDLRSALRDPAKFADADSFRPGERSDPGLAFGMGRHRCPGRPLARMLAVEAAEAVVELWGDQPCEVLTAGGRPNVPVFSGPTRLVVVPPFDPRSHTPRATADPAKSGDRDE